MSPLSGTFSAMTIMPAESADITIITVCGADNGHPTVIDSTFRLCQQPARMRWAKDSRENSRHAKKKACREQCRPICIALPSVYWPIRSVSFFSSRSTKLFHLVASSLGWVHKC